MSWAQKERIAAGSVRSPGKGIHLTSPPRCCSRAQSSTDPDALHGILRAPGTGRPFGGPAGSLFFGVTFGDREGGRESFFGEKLRCFKLHLCRRWEGVRLGAAPPRGSAARTGLGGAPA